MIKSLIANVNKHLADRRRYLAAVAEIDSLSAAEIADLRVDPLELRRQAYLDVYGQQVA
jgi:uncharacterized protein (UPF0216 family)